MCIVVRGLLLVGCSSWFVAGWLFAFGCCSRFVVVCCVLFDV